MELLEIKELILSAAEEHDIEMEYLDEYEIHLTIDKEGSDKGFISDIDKNIEINEKERVIYITVQLY